MIVRHARRCDASTALRLVSDISHIQPGTVNVKLNLSVVENLFYCFHVLRAMAQVFIFVFFYVVLYPEILTLKKK